MSFYKATVSAYNQSFFDSEKEPHMELIRGLYNVISKHCQGAVTIGNFDGVHLGHQYLLSELKKQAAILNIPTIVITFEPQPNEFFAGAKGIPRLTRLREKFTALENCGIDYLLVLPFNKVLANLTAEDFINKILIDKLQTRYLLVGDDFKFGKNRQGNFALLKEAGFSVAKMESFLIEGERVSSTRVRSALAADNQTLVNKLLGRPYQMAGRIIRGDQRGRSIGFPTANIYLHRQVTPVEGVYVVKVKGIDTTPLPGVANVGIRPTIGGTRSLLEVHIFDFDRDIYGAHVEVEFCQKLRDEKRFENLDLLKQQIFADAEQARLYFANITY